MNMQGFVPYFQLIFVTKIDLRVQVYALATSLKGCDILSLQSSYRALHSLGSEHAKR